MNITVRDLLDAGVHFGHQRKRWNPRSKDFVYDHRHGVSIIDLEKSYAQLETACQYLEDLVANDGVVLLVGTKRQAQDMIREAASATGMPFCASRWLGGMLTNFETIKRSLAKYKRFQAMESDGTLAKLAKKEGARIKREMARMHRNFEGIQDIDKAPSALFVIDIRHEEIAVAEANRLGIPIVALVDTNSDPTRVTHPIPGNDDAVKSIRIILDAVVEAIQNGVSRREERRAARGASAAATRADIDKEAAARLAEGEDAGGVIIDGQAIGGEASEKEEAPANVPAPAPAAEVKEGDAEPPAAEAKEQPPAEGEKPEEPAGKPDTPSKKTGGEGAGEADGETKKE